jgi:hypothetical protein
MSACTHGDEIRRETSCWSGERDFISTRRPRKVGDFHHASRRAKITMPAVISRRGVYDLGRFRSIWPAISVVGLCEMTIEPVDKVQSVPRRIRLEFQRMMTLGVFDDGPVG